MRWAPCTGRWRSGCHRRDSIEANIGQRNFGRTSMQGKIALEEHFAIPETLMDSAGFVPDSYWPKLKSRLLDIQDRRLGEMDRNGIDVMILSLNAPAVQAIPETAKA